jgi:hypothetical protein
MPWKASEPWLRRALLSRSFDTKRGDLARAISVGAPLRRRSGELHPEARFLVERVVVHELWLMEEVVAAVTRIIGTARVHVVRLVVGQRAVASALALRSCFEVCASGTALEGAALDIVETDGDELVLEEVEVS